MTMQEGREADVRSGTGKDPWARFGWLMAVVWLVFLIYPVLALLASAAPPAWVVTGWVALVAFIVLYVTGFLHGMRGGGGLGRAPSRRQWITFAALIACALVTIPAVGGSALSFLPFIMSFASYGLTRAWHWITTIAALVVAAGCVFLIPDNLSYLSVLAIVTLLGVVNTVSTWLIVRSAEAERLGRELATSEGREAVARDVHDLIGHSLTVVGLKAQLVRRLMDSDPERAKAELADIERLTAEAIAGVRQTVAGARATTLVEQLASTEDSLRAADIALVVDGTPDALSPVQAITASWILREATTNTLRHSGAAAVRVRIAPGVLTVEDDGVGLASATGHREGNGIRGMRERAAAAGAGFTMRPGEVAGTRVEVTW
jgi:two-component system, NarL family, sensor histidine kinase DesK